MQFNYVNINKIIVNVHKIDFKFHIFISYSYVLFMNSNQKREIVLNHASRKCKNQ